MDQTPIERMKELIAILSEAGKAYYQESREIMSNYDYDRLYGALLHHEASVLLDCSVPYVMTLFDAVTFDHPELFWSNYEYNYNF